MTASTNSMIRRLFHSLSFKLSLTLGLILFGAILVFSFICISHQEKEAVRDVILDVNRFSDTLLRCTTYAMMVNQRENIKANVEAVGEQKWVERIRIINKEGIISFSTRSSEIGKKIDRNKEACQTCHQYSPPPANVDLVHRSRIYQSFHNSRAVGIISPIFNQPGCSSAACHAHKPGQKMLGVLDVVMSLKPVDAETERSQRDFFLFALALFLAVSTICGLYLIFAVGRPMAELARITRRIARGDFSQDITIKNKDEIGDLALAFNSMRKSIKEKTDLLKRSRDEYQYLFERVPCYITVQDRDLKLLTYNREFEREFGPINGIYCYQAYKRRETPCENCMVALTMQDGQIHTSEEEGITRDGKKRIFLIQTAPVRDDRGEITGVMEMSTDVTAIRNLTEELERSERKYRIIFDSVPSAIFVLDPVTYRIVDINERAVKGYGYSQAELLSMSFLDLSPEEDRADMAFKLGTGGDIANITHLKKEGDVIYVNVRVSPSVYGKRNVLIVTTHNVTARLQTEQQLIQASKMATLGEMSTGVAHELNQPLSVIKTASNVILKRLAGGKEVGQTLLADLNSEIDSQVDRASRIINHMREFGRKPEIKKQEVQVNDAVLDAFTVFGQQLKLREIEVELDLDDTIPLVLADKNRLEQVFVNLILNARDAIEEKKTRFPLLENDKRITIRSFREDDSIVVTVMDTGIGMSRKVQSKVFEPFFTTKGAGKGTGLGLSISYGIIRDYDGTIDIASEEGKGATFTIRFPVVKENS